MPTDVVDPLKSDRADEPVRSPRLGFFGTLRWGWRQLTSMRTALFLLFLLAVAAVPGSVVPQRGVSPLRVSDVFAQHPSLAPVMDRFSLFDVYGSPWFAAIYLLLMVSLAGCIFPRCTHYVRAMRARPPRTPRNLRRLPIHREVVVTSPPAEALAKATAALADDGFRVEAFTDDASVGAEKGYLHELGNLVFHLALFIILVGVAAGALFGYHGTVVVVEGEGFANTLTQYDDFTPGRRFSPTDLAPFSFTLDTFDASFVSEGPRRGQPNSYRAGITFRPEPGDPGEPKVITVNEPLSVDGSKIYLLGNGYAPKFTVRDGKGDVVFAGAVPALPQDPAFTSKTAVKVPDAQPDQLGFNVTVTPTAPLQVDPATGPISSFPEANNPRAYLGAWVGDLGMDSGTPQNIYQLDTSAMKQIGLKQLAPGQTWKLPGDRGSITFDGLTQFGNFEIAHDPGRFVALVGALAAIVGVMGSLFIRRRRVWVRATPQGSGRTLVEVGGLARSEASSLPGEVERIVSAVEGGGPLKMRQTQETG